MDDEIVKSQIIEAAAECHGVPSNVAEEEWEHWSATTEAQSALDEASMGDFERAQTQFADHLSNVGATLVSGRKYKSGGGGGASRYMHKVSPSGYSHVNHHTIHHPKSLDSGHPLGRRGAYYYQAIGDQIGAAEYDEGDGDYEDELFSIAQDAMPSGEGVEDKEVGGSDDADMDPEAVFGVSASRRAMAQRAFLKKVGSGVKPVAASAARVDELDHAMPVGGPYGHSEISARDAARDPDYLDKLVMDADPYLKMSERRAYKTPIARKMGTAHSRNLARRAEADYDIDEVMASAGLFGGDDDDPDYQDHGDDGEAKIVGGAVPDDLKPIGAEFGQYRFTKMLVALLRRHRTDSIKMETHGSDVGRALAKEIQMLDKRGMGRARFPESAAQQRYRRNAVVRVLIRLLGAVSSDVNEYRAFKLAELSKFLRSAASGGPYKPSGDSVDGAMEQIGQGPLDRAGIFTRGGIRRAKRFGRATKKKYRAGANMRDRSGVASGIITLVRRFMPAPGTETGVSQTQIDFDDMVGRYVNSVATSVRKNPGMGSALVDLVVGAVRRYVIDDGFRFPPATPIIASAALEEVDRFPLMGYANLPAEPMGGEDLPAEPMAQINSRYRARRKLPVSASVKGMAADLLVHAEDYLSRNPTHVERSEGRLTLFVPENKSAMQKVSSRLREGGREAKDEYIVHALAAKHPHEDLKRDYLLSLSGKLFHVKESGGGGAVSRAKGGKADGYEPTKVVSQMVRVGSNEKTEHDDGWDAEARNAGGPIMARFNHHKMYCRVGEPVRVSVLGKTGLKGVSVIPLFYDIPNDDGGAKRG